MAVIWSAYGPSARSRAALNVICTYEVHFLTKTSLINCIMMIGFHPKREIMKGAKRKNSLRRSTYGNWLKRFIARTFQGSESWILVRVGGTCRMRWLRAARSHVR